MYLIGNVCREHRQENLKYTLKELSSLSGVNIKTLSAFENGRSTNINILLIYVRYTKANERLDLIKTICEVLENE